MKNKSQSSSTVFFLIFAIIVLITQSTFLIFHGGNGWQDIQFTNKSKISFISKCRLVWVRNSVYDKTKLWTGKEWVLTSEVVKQKCDSEWDLVHSALLRHQWCLCAFTLFQTWSQLLSNWSHGGHTSTCYKTTLIGPLLCHTCRHFSES